MRTRPVVRSIATFVMTLAVYFVVPAGELPSGLAALLSVVGMLVGVGVLAWLIIGQVKRELHALASGNDEEGVRIQTLLVLVYITVLVFALGYYQLDHAVHGQFAGLSTKVDSLYFTVTTLATVGFGDVHATGQLARALVTAQIVFDLVFVAVAVNTLTSSLRRRGRNRLQSEDTAGPE